MQGSSGGFSPASACTVASGTTLDLGGFNTTIGSLAGAGILQLGGGILTAGGDNSSTTFSGVLSGNGGFIKQGTGRTNLTGINTYFGDTTVNAGTLRVNGSIVNSDVTVNAGGTLGGNGTVGNSVINDGTLAPGNSIGLLSVQGNLIFTAASTYMVEVSPSHADRVNVTGTATLGGATVNATFATGSYITRQYTIVNATGAVIGTFASQVNTNLPTNFTSSLSHDAHNAYLNLTLNYVPPTLGPVFNPLNINQQNVGNTLVNYFNRTGGIPLVFGALDANGLTQASGETATGIAADGLRRDEPVSRSTASTALPGLPPKT